MKAWEEKVKALEEEQVKHRTALETELRNLKAGQEDMAAAFDASLLSLQEVIFLPVPLLTTALMHLFCLFCVMRLVVAPEAAPVLPFLHHETGSSFIGWTGPNREAM